MRVLANFVAIFGMEAGAGAGFCVFKESGCENRKRKVARYGILNF